MKYLLLFTWSIVSAMQLYGQENPSLFATLDEREILRRLYDDATVIRQSDNKLMARWKPNFAERMAFPRGLDDGMCYTEIDKIFRFSKGDSQYALFVFASYEMTSNGTELFGNCHACAPMLSVALFTENLNSNKGWSVIRFEKAFRHYGSWGEIGDMRLVQIGRNKFALALDNEEMAQGYEISSTTFYEIDGYTQIFNATTKLNNFGVTEDEDERFGFETRVEILRSGDGYYRIRCTTTGTNYLYKQDKKVSVEGVKTYVYDEEAGMYMEEQEER